MSLLAISEEGIPSHEPQPEENLRERVNRYLGNDGDHLLKVLIQELDPQYKNVVLIEKMLNVFKEHRPYVPETTNIEQPGTPRPHLSRRELENKNRLQSVGKGVEEGKYEEKSKFKPEYDLEEIMKVSRSKIERRSRGEVVYIDWRYDLTLKGKQLLLSRIAKVPKSRFSNLNLVTAEISKYGAPVIDDYLNRRYPILR